MKATVLKVATIGFLSQVATAIQAPLKPVIVSYSKDTPQSVIQQAMDAVIKAGGTITHEYQIIKGFAAKATEEALALVQAFGTDSGVNVEDDQIVTIN